MNSCSIQSQIRSTANEGVQIRRSPVEVGVTTVRLVSIRWTFVENSRIGSGGIVAIVLLSGFTEATFQTGIALCTHTDDVADFDVGDLFSDSDGFTDQLVADDLRESACGFTPTSGHRVKVRSALGTKTETGSS